MDFSACLCCVTSQLVTVSEVLDSLSTPPSECGDEKSKGRCTSGMGFGATVHVDLYLFLDFRGTFRI